MTTPVDQAPAKEPSGTCFPMALCVRVTDKALSVLLEQSAGGAGSYVDAHPWIVAHRLLGEALAANQPLALVFAAGDDPEFAHWALVTDIDLVELHRSTWQTRVRFDALRPVHPIFTGLDSLFLQPTAEQLERERVEGLSQHRQPLTLQHLHPYAIAETPAYIAAAVGAELGVE